MKFKLLCSCFVLLSLNVFSQEEDVVSLTKVSFLNPGVSQEMRVGRFQTASAQFFESFTGLSTYSTNIGFKYAYVFDPVLSVQYRY